jgi:hypothetical protein
MADDPYTPPVRNSPDGYLFRRPWELTSETLAQFRVEETNNTEHWIPPMVPSQRADPFAGAYPPLMETNVRRNNRSLNGSVRLGSRDGAGAVSPSGQGDTYMVPPKFGWRTEELGLSDIMDGVMTKLDDPANAANATYLDDWSGQQGGYGGSGQMEHNSMEIPQGL